MGWPEDGLATFFLICFLVGLLFTVVSFFMGFGHDAGIGSLDHGGGHGDGAAVGHAGGGHSGDAGGPAAAASSGPPVVNMSTVMAFVTWFGGAGYVLRVSFGASFGAALVVSIVAGLCGAGLIFAFLSKVLYQNQRVLDAKDYYLPGTLARVTSPIRVGGTGEVIFAKGGTRQVSGARSADGSAIERGHDVVIMRYEHGIAYVQSWDQLLTGDDDAEEPASPARDQQRT